MTHSPPFWTGCTGVGLFIITCVLGGWQLDDYSHVSQYISESYATGTPHGPLLRFLGFIPAGLLLALFAVTAYRRVPPSGAARAGFLILGVGYGLGTVVCSVFPCDPGCGRLSPGNTSLSQLIHNLTGLLTYLTVPWALLTLGIAARQWPGGRFVSLAGIVCGITAVVGALLFLGNATSSVAGLIQRLTEAAILAWIVICALHLRGRSRAAVGK